MEINKLFLFTYIIAHYLKVIKVVNYHINMSLILKFFFLILIFILFLKKTQIYIIINDNGFLQKAESN